MEHIGACEARTHFSRLLDRVAQGESLTITRHGKPVARLMPMDGPREEAKQAVARLIALRAEIKGVPLAELMASVHEGHRW